VRNDVEILQPSTVIIVLLFVGKQTFLLDLNDVTDRVRLFLVQK